MIIALTMNNLPVFFNNLTDDFTDAIKWFKKMSIPIIVYDDPNKCTNCVEALYLIRYGNIELNKTRFASINKFFHKLKIIRVVDSVMDQLYRHIKIHTFATIITRYNYNTVRPITIRTRKAIGELTNTRNERMVKIWKIIKLMLIGHKEIKVSFNKLPKDMLKEIWKHI